MVCTWYVCRVYMPPSFILTWIFQTELRKPSTLYYFISESYLNCSCRLGLVCSLCPLILSFISFFLISRISRSPLKTLSRQLLIKLHTCVFIQLCFDLLNACLFYIKITFFFLHNTRDTCRNRNSNMFTDCQECKINDCLHLYLHWNLSLVRLKWTRKLLWGRYSCTIHAVILSLSTQSMSNHSHSHLYKSHTVL